MLLRGLARQLDGNHLRLRLNHAQPGKERDRKGMHEQRNRERPARGSVAMPRLGQRIEIHYAVCADTGHG
jgi:hypothetical protein